MSTWAAPSGGRVDVLGVPTAETGSGRIRSVDVLRGLAIVLMLADHVLFQIDRDSTLRAGAPWSITRLSLPLFMLASAAVWRPIARTEWATVRRFWTLVPVAVAEWLLMVALGMPLPGIVGVYLLVRVAVDLWTTEPAWWLIGVVGLIQAEYVPMAWAGYQPGLVLCWFALGRLAWLTTDRVLSERLLPGVLSDAAAFVGRHPVAWYLGHLLVICGALQLGRVLA